ncbi:MAG: hypothetical protein R3C25_14435 [Hyphomonadaceae bacterium]
MSPILLVARRDYLAYVGAWGFWLSLITAPLIIAVLMFAPILLARAEPPRVLAIVAERSGDGAVIRAAFDEEALRGARGEVRAYVAAAAPALEAEAMSAFDAAAGRAAAVAAAREVIARRAPRALAAFPEALPRYLITPPPAPDIEGLRPYLDGVQPLPGGARR